MSGSPGFWSGKRVLVTGDTGFKGSWLTLLLRSAGAEVHGLSLTPQPGATYDRLGLAAVGATTIADIRDRDRVAAVLADVRPDVVFHLAAQALVRASYADPGETFDVNVTGTAMVLAESAAAASSVQVVLVVTSDKVYANDGSGRAFVESDRLGGGDPYSASKAAAEMVVASWRHSFPTGPTVVSARAGNVIGGGDQAADRLLPDLFRAMTDGRPLVVRNPASVRPWQFVLEPLAGYLAFAEAAWAGRAASAGRPEVPAALNFGPDPSSFRDVGEVVELVLARAGRGSWHHQPDPDGGPEAATLVLDSGEAQRTLGWSPILDLETALAWTLAWWEAEQAGASLVELASAQVSGYCERMAR